MAVQFGRSSIPQTNSNPACARQRQRPIVSGKCVVIGDAEDANTGAPRRLLPTAPGK